MLGLLQRGGKVVLRMVENVQQNAIEPLIRAIVTKGTRFYTDVYDIGARWPAWGDDHHTVVTSASGGTPPTAAWVEALRVA
jgi:hypothetical protein